MTLDMDSAPKGRRVAVIGSGLAGLTTAYLLRQRGLVVYLIEKVSYVGSSGEPTSRGDTDTL
jgi:flavin-dependent dehydrogenase